MNRITKLTIGVAGTLMVTLLLCPGIVLAQVQTEWVYVKQGQGSGGDVVEDITVDQAGDVYAAGWTFPAGYSDTVFTVIKVNSADGSEAWEYLYDGSGSRMNKALAICIDTISAHAPGVYAAGYTDNAATELDFTVTRFDTSGDVIWEFLYNGPDSSFDCARAITIDTVGGLFDDGGPVVAGYSGQLSGFGVAYTVIALNFATPTMRWLFQDEYAVSLADDIAQDIISDNVGYIYSTGVYVTSATQTEDITTIKHRAQGGGVWLKHYLYVPPPPSIDWERGEAVTFDPVSGDVYSAGNLAGGIDEPYIMPAVLKYNSSGTFQWIWNDPDHGSGTFDDVVVGNSGHVYAAGRYVVKLDPATGAVLHMYTDMSGSAYEMAIDGAENIYLAGYVQNASRDFAVVKLDSALNEQWVYSYDGASNGEDRAYSICVIDSANIYAAGYTTGSGTGPDFTVIKIGVVVGAEEELPTAGEENLQGPSIISGPLNLPQNNPYKVYDITGREVNENHLAPGIYFIKADGNAIRKVVKIR